MERVWNSSSRVCSLRVDRIYVYTYIFLSLSFSPFSRIGGQKKVVDSRDFDRRSSQEVISIRAPHTPQKFDSTFDSETWYITSLRTIRGRRPLRISLPVIPFPRLSIFFLFVAQFARLMQCNSNIASWFYNKLTLPHPWKNALDLLLSVHRSCSTLVSHYADLVIDACFALHRVRQVNAAPVCTAQTNATHAHARYVQYVRTSRVFRSCTASSDNERKHDD